MLEIVLTSSESDQYSSATKDISKYPLMYEGHPISSDNDLIKRKLFL